MFKKSLSKNNDKIDTVKSTRNTNSKHETFMNGKKRKSQHQAKVEGKRKQKGIPRKKISLKKLEYFRKMKEREKQYKPMVCKFFISGCCRRDDCAFSHDVTPDEMKQIQEPCKYYARGECVKGDMCVFMHGDFPCTFFHSSVGNTCSRGRSCLFSHKPLTEEMTAALTRFLAKDKVVDNKVEENATPENVSNNFGKSMFSKFTDNKDINYPDNQIGVCNDNIENRKEIEKNFNDETEFEIEMTVEKPLINGTLEEKKSFPLFSTTFDMNVNVCETDNDSDHENRCKEPVDKIDKVNVNEQSNTMESVVITNLQYPKYIAMDDSDDEEDDWTLGKVYTSVSLDTVDEKQVLFSGENSKLTNQQFEFPQYIEAKEILEGSNNNNDVNSETSSDSVDLDKESHNDKQNSKFSQKVACQQYIDETNMLEESDGELEEEAEMFESKEFQKTFNRLHMEIFGDSDSEDGNEIVLSNNSDDIAEPEFGDTDDEDKMPFTIGSSNSNIVKEQQPTTDKNIVENEFSNNGFYVVLDLGDDEIPELFLPTSDTGQLDDPIEITKTTSEISQNEEEQASLRASEICQNSEKLLIGRDLLESNENLRNSNKLPNGSNALILGPCPPVFHTPSQQESQFSNECSFFHPPPLLELAPNLSYIKSDIDCYRLSHKFDDPRIRNHPAALKQNWRNWLQRDKKVN